MKPLTILLLLALSLSAQTVNIRTLLSAAFPSDLVASPTGGMVAFQLDREGVRNLYVASPPNYAAVAVTNYKDDDGQEIATPLFTHDGKYVVYVQGGAPNRAGEIPNPSSDPQGAERSIWVVPAKGGTPKKLADGYAPVVHPTDNRIAYLNKGVWSVAIDGGKPESLVKMRGNATSLVFSPNGKKLAMVSNRGDHAFIGVYDFAAKSLLYLDPSLDQDGNPVWSADGSRVAFVRTPASKERQIFAPKRTAQPWSIRVADAETGAGREAWHALTGKGSAISALPSGGQLEWADGDRIVFTWELDGWNHLYAVSAGGGQAHQLTSGGYEVETASLTKDRKAVIAATNRDDMDRRHLWLIPVDGSPVKALTGGTGIEWAGTFTSDGKAFAYLTSGARKPAHAVIEIGTGEAKDLVGDAIPSSFPLSALVEPKPVMINASDGMPIHAQLFLPKDLKPGERRPAAIFFHGGSRRQMLLGWHYSAYYHNCYALSQYYASKGWIAMAVNYRSGIGYGMEFREALDYGATGASEFRDVQGAGLFLRSLRNVDPSRIAVWGGSYGGYLTALALSRASDLFAAGVDIHGVHDWNVVTRNFVPSYDPLANVAAAQLAFNSSPMSSVKGWRSPVLLIHGDDDRNVPFSESVTLIEELRKNKVEVEQLVFPDEVHGFLRHSSWVKAWEVAASFLERKLSKPAPMVTSGQQ